MRVLRLAWFHYFIFTVVDDGEIFQVKKSSQSRRLIKQLKAEKKAARKNVCGTIPAPKSPSSPLRKGNESIEDVSALINAGDMDIRIKGNLSTKNKRQELNSWTVSGIEAEALSLISSILKGNISRSPLWSSWFISL